MVHHPKLSPLTRPTVYYYEIRLDELIVYNYTCCCDWPDGTQRSTSLSQALTLFVDFDSEVVFVKELATSPLQL